MNLKQLLLENVYLYKKTIGKPYAIKPVFCQYSTLNLVEMAKLYQYKWLLKK